MYFRKLPTSLLSTAFGIALGIAGCGGMDGSLDLDEKGTGGGSGGDGSGAGVHVGQGGDGSGAGTTGGGAGTTGGGAGTTGGGAGSGEGGTPNGGGGSDPGGTCGGQPPADPSCYWENVCPDASLGDLEQSYSPGGWLSTTLEMLDRRYPSAKCLVDMYQNDAGNYADSSSFAALAESLMTVAHEETHGYDYEHANWGSTFAYYARCDLTMTTPWIDGFGRSEILPLVATSSTNLYDGTYLTGQQGTYGFSELLDEWNAYLNGMAAIALVGDAVDVFGISGTDGALAFAYYVELYLHLARTQYPAVYAEITGSPQVVDLLRLQWNRMHFFLSYAEKFSYLSIEADGIKQVLYQQDNLDELTMAVGTPMAPGNCN